MYESEELNHDFAFKSIASFCTACLSSDRSLFSIGEYEDLFKSISNNIFPQPLMLCWECMAVLKKIKLFKEKLEEAQRILHCHYLNKENLLLQSLSKLKKTYNGHAIIINYDDKDDRNQELESKLENENSNDSFHNFEHNDIFEKNDLCLQEIKKNDTCHQEMKKDDTCHQEMKNDDTSHQEIKNDDFCHQEMKNDDTSHHEIKNDDFCHKEIKKDDICHQEIKKDDIFHQEIKKENVIGKKVPSNRSLRYKIVHEKNAKKDLKKKFAIKPEDSKIWLEREKNNDLFKKFKHQCDLCVNGFKTKEKFKRHIQKIHESRGPFVCPTCSKRFYHETLLNAHMEAHKFAWECVRCDFQCYFEKTMNAHVKTHTHIHARTFECLICEAKFQDLATFKTHYKSVHNVFICDHCGKRCKTKLLIEKHMRHHLERHVCQTCSRSYKHLQNLQTHIRQWHSECAPEEAYCVLCDKQFVSPDIYKRHVLNSAAHNIERDYKRVQCPECSNTYAKKMYMMQHYRHVHMNQSKYYCSECDLHFLNGTRLTDHKKYKHKGLEREKNKFCNICGRGFSTALILLHHIRTHTGERPYQCEHCPAKFAQKIAMVSHVKRIHLKCKRRPQ